MRWVYLTAGVATNHEEKYDASKSADLCSANKLVNEW